LCRRVMWVSHVARVRNAYRVLDGKPERSRPLGRRECGWKDALR
jgi:hypothetical protein